MARSNKPFSEHGPDDVFGVIFGDNDVGWQEDMGVLATRAEVEEHFGLDPDNWDVCTEGCCGVQNPPGDFGAFTAPFVKLFVHRNLDDLSERVKERAEELADFRDALVEGIREAIRGEDSPDPRMN